MDDQTVPQKEIDEAKMIANELTTFLLERVDNQGRLCVMALGFCLGAHISSAPRDQQRLVIEGIEELVRDTVTQFNERSDKAKLEDVTNDEKNVP